MPRGIIPAPHGATPAPPDVPNYSWVEYGMRVGTPRIMKMTADRGYLECFRQKGILVNLNLFHFSAFHHTGADRCTKGLSNRVG